MNDWEVLDRHVSGDRAAIDQLVRKHIHFVFSTARRLVSATEADDVVQAVFLLLTQKAASIPRRGTLTGWLYRATRYCCSNLRRMEARRRRHEMEAAMKAPQPPPPEFADAAWFEALDAALDRLNATERDAVLLHYLQQQTFEETGQAIGITPEAARKRTGRALEKLRTHFLKKGYAVGSAVAVGGSLQAATRTASAATINASLMAAHGKAGVAIVSVAQAASQVMAAAKIKAIIISSVAAAIAVTAGIWGIMVLRGPAAPVRLPAKVAEALPAPKTPQNNYVSALPQIQLDAQPSEAEAKRVLKTRLQILSNFVARYSVHTEYPAPPGGWANFVAATLPVSATGGLPFSIDRPTTVVYASGTADLTKTLAMRDGRARYERMLVKADREVPLPPDAREIYSQTYISLPNGSNLPRVERLFLDRARKVMVADVVDGDLGRATDRLPEPDLEAVLALRPPVNGPTSRKAAAQIDAQTIDSMQISFPDPDHAVASMMFNRIPVEWSLDRSKGYAPLAFRYGSEMEMKVDEFQNASGMILPAKITSTFSTPQADARIWRKETLSVTSLQLADPANGDEQYAMAWPAAQPAAPRGDKSPAIEAIEARLGGESIDISGVVKALSVSRDSPSKAVPQENAYWLSRHEQYVQQAKRGGIDVLLLGDKPIEDWHAQSVAWDQYLAPHHAAAFGIAGDRVENLLWRINHGELEGISPKVIVLFIGGTDAAIDGRFAYGPGGGGRSDAFTFSNQLRADSPEAIVAGIQEIVRSIHEKSPRSRIVLTGLCHSVFNRGGSAAAYFQPRAGAINAGLAKLDNGATLRYLNIAPAFVDAEGGLAGDIQGAPNVAGIYQATYQRWGRALEPLLTGLQ